MCVYEVSGCLQCCVFCVCFKLFWNVLSKAKYTVFLLGSGAQAGWSAGQRRYIPESELELHLMVLTAVGPRTSTLMVHPRECVTTGEVVNVVFGVCGCYFISALFTGTRFHPGSLPAALAEQPWAAALWALTAQPGDLPATEQVQPWVLVLPEGLQGTG